MNTNEALTLLGKPKQKFTLLIVGGGVFGCDVRKPIVTRGIVNTTKGDVLCYSEPRGKKIFGMLAVLKHGSILLRGHEESRPVFESHARATNGIKSFVMDGVGGRFIDHNKEGADALIDYLKQHVVLHTLSEKNNLVLLCEDRDGSSNMRTQVDPEFKSKLLNALGPATEFDALPPAEPTRKELLTPKMKQQLMERDVQDSAHPLFKIFDPAGAGTWVLFSLESDGDTLWAACDLGQGVVEYGTVSLSELETVKGSRFKLPMERDIHFNGSKLTLAALLERTSLAGC